ncbi:3'-5' exonuclease [Agromyces humi]|uniref:3'-5' exonuclease n=1 Tax=Agromyces humi TaxID=1766800 RepID=UPI001F409273|nr:3'-5' exonuclease [Agromyces humi]
MTTNLSAENRYLQRPNGKLNGSDPKPQSAAEISLPGHGQDSAHVTGMTSATPQDILTSEIPDLCVFDLETTGIDVFDARIVTAYLGRVNRQNQITGSYSWLVNPGIEIPEGAAAVHGISTEVAVRDGRDPAESVNEILTVIRRSISTGRPIVAYNAAYDLSLLNAEARRYGLDPIDDWGVVIDPLIIDKKVDKYRRGKRTLEVTAAHYGITLEGAHDSMYDAIATGAVTWQVLGTMIGHRDFGDYRLSELHALQAEWAREQQESFQAYKRSNGEPDFTVDFGWPERDPRTPSTEEKVVSAAA